MKQHGRGPIAFAVPWCAKSVSLWGGIQLDETFVGGKNQNESIVLVAAEEGGRVRLVQAPGNY